MLPGCRRLVNFSVQHNIQFPVKPQLSVNFPRHSEQPFPVPLLLQRRRRVFDYQSFGNLTKVQCARVSDGYYHRQMARLRSVYFVRGPALPHLISVVVVIISLS